MKKYILSCLLWCLITPVAAITYYVDSREGNDANSGKSANLPFRTLERLNSLKLNPGDSVLLHTGSVHMGGVVLTNIAGSAEAPIVISAYDTQPGRRCIARIDAKNNVAGVLLENCRYLTVSRLHITADGGTIDDVTRKMAMRCGVLVRVTAAGQYGDICLEQLHIQDIFYNAPGTKRGVQEVRTENGTQPYGWGIRFINTVDGAQLNNLTVKQCTVENVAHTGIKLTGKGHNIRHFVLIHNRVTRTGGPGIQASGVIHGRVSHNHVSYSGAEDDSRKWGRGSGLWTWSAEDVRIEKNHFLYANGPGDSAGAHIDYNCKDVVLQYNFSAYNAGGFCEILGNNYNCAYRYNISVNDGFRKKGEGGAFQEGKTLWTSGYMGNKKRVGPFNSYIYNNTIFVSHTQTARIAIGNTTDGLLIVNNIFYLAGDVRQVLGDQYNPEKQDGKQATNVLFKNNLFSSVERWNRALPIQDEAAIEGDLGLVNAGGLSLLDYIPGNAALVKDKGIVIPLLPGDTKGLPGGLTMPCDILGNPIEGAPDMGAIELGVLTDR